MITERILSETFAQHADDRPEAQDVLAAVHQRSPGFEEHDYTVSVDGTEMDVIIWVLNGNSLPTRTEAGGNYRELTINGHHAREFIADVATIVAVDIGHGKIAFAGPSVVATSSTVTTARISAIARHVVRSIEYGRHDPLPKN